MALSTFPQERRSVVDLGLGQTLPAAALGELLHCLDSEFLGHGE